MDHGQPRPITVSTLAEAEAFARAEYSDITYAVGIAPHKLPRVQNLLTEGVQLRILLDSTKQAEAVAAASRESGVIIPALIEIDSDGHRGGLSPRNPLVLEIGRTLHQVGCLAGVLTHAGESYYAPSQAAKREAAENERAQAVMAAQRLREAACEVGIVSVGSTPTAHFYQDLSGVTEVRAGNYIFFDLVMAGIGVCQLEDIALSVAVTVIGHQPDKGWILTDGGWMAMSRDRGTAKQDVDQGYGLVTDAGGQLIDGLVMTDASQEHGVLTMRDSSPMPELPLGTRLRILPNHACATAAQYQQYQVIDSKEAQPPGDSPTVVETWKRIQGW